MKLLQLAVAKTLNSLSWQEKIIEPEIVSGTSGSLMVFDLRQLQWTAGNQWLEIVKRYPYGLKFDYVSDPVLKQLAADVQELSQAEMPLLRADWFVYAVLQPPLYPELLQLPSEFRDLEQRLGVEIEQNIARGEVARAGISRSGMSPQNRLIERHEGKFGAVWVGYEFLPRRGKGDLLRFPLGPRSDSHSFNRHAFEADGRSVLFHLPNGMLGYYLVDSSNQRVDQVAETSLAFDVEAITGTPQMVSGLSCLNCHHHGLQTDFRDEVRSAGVLSGDGLERVGKIYLTADRMQALAQRDQQIYLSALNQLASDDRASPVAALDSGSSIASTSHRPEPIGFMVTCYLRDLGPGDVAAELGLPNIEAIRLQIQLKPSLRQLGLGTLLQEQAGSIKRARWEAIDGTSLFQDVAVELGLGTPIQAGSTHKPRKSKP
jgi:serine/threonine-protein kinase